jgi:hypothetical protein
MPHVHPRWQIRYLPLFLFLLVYVLSGLVGALLIVANYGPFVSLYEYFSGTRAPTLHGSALADDLLLLLLAPFALSVGYWIGDFAWQRWAGSRPGRSVRAESSLPAWVAHAVFYGLAIAGAVSLARAGAFGRLHSWSDFGSWVHARAANFSHIGFAGFANLYIVLPTAAAWASLVTHGRSLRSHLVRWLPVATTLALSLLLYERKALITVVLIFAFAWFLDLRRAGIRGPRWVVAGTAAAIAAIYFAAVVVPVYSEASHAVQRAEHVTAPAAPAEPAKPAKPGPATTVDRRELQRLAKAINFKSRRQAIAVYALVSPITRSSVPALYYPLIFPREHAFYGPDLGQDVLGIGAMPDDNIVVWNVLNPNLPGGTTQVPYQFVLYAQVGTWWTVVWSVAIGALLALAWLASQLPAVSRPWNALVGSMILLLASFLGIDSLRNSVLVSYGVLWGVLFVAAAAMLSASVSAARTGGLPRRGRPSARTAR